ncbi:transposase [Coprobacillus cateniformis]|nr:transposase [Coprobacillus cateniformis]
MPRVHTVTAYALISHIAEIERFQNANKVTSYAGVTPVFFSSAVKGKNVQNKNQGNRNCMQCFIFCYATSTSEYEKRSTQSDHASLF